MPSGTIKIQHRHLLLLSFILLLGGCAALEPTRADRPAPGPLPRTVAVLPFEGPEGKEEGRRIVRGVVYNHLSGTTYEVLKLHLVDERLQTAQLLTTDAIARQSPQELGALLKADAILYGTVTHYNRLYALLYSQVAVGAKIRLVEAGSGKLIWEREEVARIHAGGVAVSPWGAAFTAATTALNLREAELLHASDDFGRKLLHGLPTPPLSEARRPPRLDRVLSDGAGRVLKAGDMVTVIMEGEAGHVATFDLLPLARNIPMTESPEGVYTGRQTVRPGENAQDAYVVARLIDAQGRLTERQEILGRFTVDSSPPVAPAGLMAAVEGGSVHLYWHGNAESDLVGYRVYRSITPLTGFAVVATAEEPSYRDPKVEYRSQYYYRVTAVDRAGNESAFPAAVAAVPVRPGPTEVSGSIADDTTWYAGSGSYLITGDVVVEPGATLTVEPGTEVRSRGGSLTVRGRLVASGEAGRKITFVADKSDSRWGGIVIEHGEQPPSELRRCELRHAGVGIRVVSGALTVMDCRVAEQTTGILISGAKAMVTVQASTIERNLADGIVIKDGARAVIERSAIAENGENGIRIEQASPRITGNRIAKNAWNGIAVRAGAPLLRQNQIVENGRPQVLNQAQEGPLIEANENYWGTTDPGLILASVQGLVEVSSAMDGPPPAGKVLTLPILNSPLTGHLTHDSFLVHWRSPYLVQGPVLVSKGVTLHILPGVVLKVASGAAGFVVQDGAILAKGTADRPITFTSASQAPVPGDFRFAVQVAEGTSRSSSFERVRFEYAATALRVESGIVEVTHGEIRDNRQSGVEVLHSGVLKIAHSQIRGHRTGAAITVRGFGRMSLRRSAVTDNGWALLNYSSLQVDARENWWGSPTPDEALFVGSVDRRDRLTEAPRTSP